MANLSRLGPNQNKILKYFFVILDQMEKSRKTISRDSLFKRRNRPGPGSKNLQILLQLKRKIFKIESQQRPSISSLHCAQKGELNLLYIREDTCRATVSVCACKTFTFIEKNRF